MASKMYKRRLESLIASSKKSILLLGPRQTGKSTLIEKLNPDLSFNLFDEATFLAFASNPGELKSRITEKTKTIFIDEVQRLPSLLNTAQTLIDTNKSIKFFFTGSSARKLRRGRANLLPGRIHDFYLGPLVSGELNYQINTELALQTGTLPGIYTSDDLRDRKKTLRAYAGTYLKEEIQAEGLAKTLEGFARFLKVSAACSGQFLDLAKLASQAQVPRQSAVRYFEILEDTLIVHRCDAFAKSDRIRLLQHPKYFFFDTGVLNGVLGNFNTSADRIGVLFEHLIANQIISSARANDQEFRLSTFRTGHGAEVDFILEVNEVVYAIEVKASRNFAVADTRGFESFHRFFQKSHKKIVLYLGDVEKQIENIEILPWQIGLKRLGL